MSEEDDKPDRQVESIRLNIGEEVVEEKSGKLAWLTIRELGRGAFGTVYHVSNKSTKQEAALKIERMTAGDNLLKIEREIMVAMQHEPTAIHIYDDGIYKDYRYIVMTLCGPDLQKIAELMNNNFNQDTIIRVCIRTLLAIKTMHEYTYIHRDLKPCNFAVDFNPNSLHVYLFDYGMARKYATKDSGNKWQLRRPRNPAQFRGTVRYCSLNMHKRKELSRVDDLWSWFFMLMEMYAPLPWTSSNIPERIEALKEDHLNEYLSKDSFLSSFLPLVEYLNSVQYADRPDYMKIYDILYAKLTEINGKLSGPMKYDVARINALVAELGETARPKELSRMDDESTIQKYLLASFGRAGVPGGNNLIMAELVDFFAKDVPLKKAREEKTDDNKKQKNAKVKNKMLGKPKQPGSGGANSGDAKTAQSKLGSKMSTHKKAKASKRNK
ncbi:Protein kinase domain-containing protein [Caenorhabditis elegans]|uniref:Protein kinase domain-containing protein n=1 Tax=Caenorhabditis elegans TaxID=6239 RepID=Q95Y99_CAEEL|nr:Protein kinase domain-containing protein [Caenorhabditis elegans]CCD64226.1 Protein kinase domain-containing protein [Caenorhabditis elegans]|eukprot:NP_491444.3 Uncharacterized protein CELE_M04F3.3 [Caenorhabditis elegans]